MPVFYYKALNQQGKTTKGHIDAASEAAVAGSLRSKSLFVLEVTKTTKSQAPEESPNDPNTPSRGTSGNRTLGEKYQPISTQERVFFFRQLGVMLRSGLPLLQALDVCKLQGMNPRLVCKIDDMIMGIQKGKSLSQW